jgi:hypothetical protein
MKLLLFLRSDIKSITRIILQMSKDLQQKYFKEHLYPNINIAVREKIKQGDSELLSSGPSEQ